MLTKNDWLVSVETEIVLNGGEKLQEYAAHASLSCSSHIHLEVLGMFLQADQLLVSIFSSAPS